MFSKSVPIVLPAVRSIIGSLVAYAERPENQIFVPTTDHFIAPDDPWHVLHIDRYRCCFYCCVTLGFPFRRLEISTRYPQKIRLTHVIEIGQAFGFTGRPKRWLQRYPSSRRSVIILVQETRPIGTFAENTAIAQTL